MKGWGIALGVILIVMGYLAVTRLHSDTVTRTLLNPISEEKKELQYEKYSFERLALRGGRASNIEIVGDKFYYLSEGRRISGMVTRPSGSDPVGIVVMARGYVDKEIYQMGMGTKNAAKYYAEHGYMTYAPDFSGYGESDPEDEYPFGARLVKPVEILDLIASIKTDKPIYLWGHSNGGQIMLSVAECLRGSSLKVRGMILWAPVSKPFPYNVLYYADEASDSGKWLRGEVAKFEAEYDVFNYSIDRYLDWIQIPIQLHQGSADQEVPVWWSRELVEELRNKNKVISLYEYSGANHNLQPGWDRVVARDVSFMNSLN